MKIAGLDHIVLNVNDINIMLNFYCAERYGVQGDGLSMYIKDPEGNEIELKAAVLT